MGNIKVSSDCTLLDTLSHKSAEYIDLDEPKGKAFLHVYRFKEISGFLSTDLGNVFVQYFI